MRYQPPSKNTTPYFLPSPPLNRQTVQALTRQPPPPPPYIDFSWPPLKVGSFSEPPKYYSFLSLIPSYLKKITKFFGKISQFEFLVMTEKNIFGYKLFLSLISHPPPPLKVEVLSSPSPFENLVRGSIPPPPPAESGWGGGGCTLWETHPGKTVILWNLSNYQTYFAAFAYYWSHGIKLYIAFFLVFLIAAIFNLQKYAQEIENNRPNVTFWYFQLIT